MCKSIDDKIKDKEHEYFLKFGEEYLNFNECTKEEYLQICEQCIKTNNPWPKPNEYEDY